MIYPAETKRNFYAWQPSTWPESPKEFNVSFIETLRTIFEDALLVEIGNVIKDAPTLEHRGHVVALSILCAIDTLASYSFKKVETEVCEKCRRGDTVGPSYKKYVERFFPDDYKPYAEKIYKLYRNSVTHSWNLFEAGMSPYDITVQENGGLIMLGLPHFYKALKKSVDNFLYELKSDLDLQNSAMARYKELKSIAI